MDINLIENMIKELQNKGKIDNKEDLETLITDLHRVKNDMSDLQNKNEELNNRFGLFWKEVPEKMIKNISDNEIVYGKSLYSFITKIKNGEDKTIKANINGEEVKLSRQSDSYLFKDSNKNEYLVFSDSLYKFSRETEEEYIPILKEKGGDFFIGNNEDNILIEGDNYYALQMLQYTHKGKIDVIYIDPPYNTGNKDFKYNDRFVKDGDSDKHSAWLSFMDKRLRLAKNILSIKGFIAIHIDDVEQANLKLLCDKIFGENNRTNDVSVKMSELSGVKMKHVASGNKYPKVKESILIYAKNSKHLNLKIPKTKKESWDKEYNMIIPNLDKQTRKELNILLKNKEIDKVKRIITEKKLNIKTITEYCKEKNIIKTDNFLFENSFRIFGTKPNKSLLRYIQKLNQPLLNEDVSTVLNPSGEIKLILTHFNKTTKTPRIEICFSDLYLDTYISDMWTDINTISISSEMPKSMNVFSNGQKPIKLLKRIIDMIPNNSVVLDFFAGSGSTGHAVWDLNKADKGNRKFILCTNNENNICEGVTFNRLKGLGKEKEYNESLKYLTINHVSEKVLRKEDNQGQFETLKEIVNLKYNSFKVIEENDEWYANENIAILKDFDYIEEFKEKFESHKYLGFVTNEDTEWNIFKEKLISVKKEDYLTQFSSSYMNEIRKVIKGNS